MLVTFLIASPIAIAALFAFARVVDPITGQLKR